jgi:hypothetical protein
LLGDAVQALLADQAFDADWPARLPYRFDPTGRNALIARLVRGARVLHLGFADHAPLIAAKRAQGVWLHDHVRAEAQVAWGVDIHAEAVALAQTLGVPDLHVADVHAPAMADLVQRLAPDCCLLPDVLEHLHEPVAFVQRLAQLMPQARLVVSVPNGLSLRNQLQALRGVERINTDHLCWYSPFTTLKLLRRGGYEAEALWAAQIAPAGSVAGRLLAAAVARRPLWADNLVVVARRAASAPQPG